MEKKFEIRQWGEIPSLPNVPDWVNKSYDGNDPLNSTLRDKEATQIEGVCISDTIHYSVVNRPLIQLEDNILINDIKIDALFNSFGMDGSSICGFNLLPYSTQEKLYFSRGAFIKNGNYVDFRYKIFYGQKTKLEDSEENPFLEISATNEASKKYYIYVDENGLFLLDKNEILSGNESGTSGFDFENAVCIAEIETNEEGKFILNSYVDKRIIAINIIRASKLYVHEIIGESPVKFPTGIELGEGQTIKNFNASIAGFIPPSGFDYINVEADLDMKGLYGIKNIDFLENEEGGDVINIKASLDLQENYDLKNIKSIKNDNLSLSVLNDIDLNNKSINNLNNINNNTIKFESNLISFNKEIKFNNSNLNLNNNNILNIKELGGYSSNDIKINSNINFNSKTIKNAMSDAGGSVVPVGTILPYMGLIKNNNEYVIPNGYLLCDGSAISVNDFNGLFNVIKYGFGCVYSNAPISDALYYGSGDTRNTGTATIVTGSGSGSNIQYAFDNADTTYTTITAASGIIRIKFSWNTTPQIVKVLSIQSKATSNNFTPQKISLEGSNDESTWITLTNISNQTSWGTKEKKFWAFDNNTSYQHYRITINGFNDSSQKVEFVEIGLYYNNSKMPDKFRIPDLRGYFLRGRSGGIDVDPDRDSRSSRGDGIGGNEVGTIQMDQFKAHYHTYVISWDISGGNYGLLITKKQESSRLTSTVGGTETRPKNIYVNYIIKY